MNILIRSVAVTIGALGVVGLVGVAPATAIPHVDASVVADDSPVGFVADGPVSPDIFLSPWETLQCRSGNTGFTVASYFDYNLGQHVNMNCGTALGSGWLHIENGHQSDWQSLLDLCRGYGGCRDSTFQWDDLMNAALIATLEAALQIVQQPANNTVCYSTTMHLVDFDTGEVMKTAYTVLVITTDRDGSSGEPQIVITT